MTIFLNESPLYRASDLYHDKMKRKEKTYIGTNPWFIVSVIVVFIALILSVVVAWHYRFQTKRIFSGLEIVDSLNDAFNNVIGIEAVYKGVEDKGDFYDINYLLKGVPTVISVTKDLKLARLEGSDWVDVDKLQDILVDIYREERVHNKADIPHVELFAMSYCPYSLQAEKAILPLKEVFKDKIKIDMHYLHYVLDGDKEKNENIRQICIRNEFEDKFFLYLECFAETGDSSVCLERSEIDIEKLNNCESSRGKDYHFNESVFSREKVENAPVLFINGEKIDFFPRSTKNAMNLICEGFIKQPRECKALMPRYVPSAGFGFGIDESGETKYCGE